MEDAMQYIMTIKCDFSDFEDDVHNVLMDNGLVEDLESQIEWAIREIMDWPRTFADVKISQYRRGREDEGK
jgi:hypothetical protein